MNTKKIFFAALVAFGIQSTINAQSTDPNILIGLSGSANGVNIKTNWPNYSGGWTRGFNLSNQDGSEKFILFGAKGQAVNGISSIEYGYIGRDYNDTFMSFLPNGNVGIGTINPIAKLHIQGGVYLGNGGAYDNIILETGQDISSFNGVFDIRPRTIPGTGTAKHLTHFRDVTNSTGAGTTVHNVAIDGKLGIGNTNPDMKLGVYTDHKYVSRFHSTASETMTGIRIGRVSNSGGSYADLVNLTNGFGIGVGSSGSSLPLNSQNTNHVSIFTDYSSRNVGIGTVNPGSWKLAVNGKIRAKEIKVETGWSDFVFEKEYNLPTLEEVENHIAEKGHLKDIPSAAEVEQNGIFLGEMDSKLLQKIEELTLYTIAQQKEIQQLKEENNQLKLLFKEIENIKSQINKIKKH